MANEAMTEPKSQPFPLRFAELNISAGVWPCPEDKLGRDKEIENLSPVLLNAQAPLVFALDAPWGGGKTTFIRLWQSYLAQESQKKVSIYLNAWESDFSEDPLIPLLSALDSWLSNLQGSGEAKEAWKAAKTLAPKILKGIAVAGIKLGTMGAIDASDAIEDVISSAAGDITGDIVDSFNSKLTALAEFKKLLKKALKALPAGQENLIIFVDELDRCRPTYAIEVLERIKHLFDIDRIVFVLSINRDQLSKSLQGVYGPSFDGSHYLKRFIDLDYQLRVPDIESYVKAKLSLPDIVANFGSRNRGKDHLVNVKDTIVWLATRFAYQPRDIDQCVTRLRLIFRSIPSNHSLDTATLICMLFLRQNDKHLYHRFKLDPSCVNEVILFLVGEDIEKAKLIRGFGWKMGCLLRSCYDNYQGKIPDEIMQYWNDLHEKLEEGTDSKREVAGILRQSNNFNDTWGISDIRQTAFDRIELVSQIQVSA